MSECSVCNVEFSMMEEGGIEGNFGILPVAFCPTCLCSCIDMVNQLQGAEDEYDS
jgi:hypothetical protein